jgi:hypothetical protein
MASCTNPTCVQYRIQHKNMTLKKIDLEKELEALQKIHSTHYNTAVTHNAIARVRDAATGDMGLMMPNGEVMTREKVMKKIEIAAKCMETSAAYEKHNRSLTEEIRLLKINYDKAYSEMRRMEHMLTGFERTRKYEPLTDQTYAAALKLNEQLAEEVEALERKVHGLQEENEMLSSRSRTAQSRTRIADDDEDTAESHITADGRIPELCPVDGENCQRYEPQVICNPNPANAFRVHMAKVHQCVHCRRFVKDPKTNHEQMCDTRQMKGRIGKKKPRETALDSDEERGWEQYTLTPQVRSPEADEVIDLFISQQPQI